ncbi:MAG: hypothetical protein K2H18_02040 [Muribaculaceae bacterium]|nr:hypothetical protein [Muribaculaceae bacterium]
MKKCINFVLIVALTIMVAACGGKNDAVLKAQIESGKKHCPMNLGMAGKLTSMSYDEENGVVNFDISLNKQLTDVKELQADQESAKEAMRYSLSKGDMNKLLEMMVDAQAGLKITYKNRGSKDEFELAFTPEELKNIYDNPMSEEDANKMLLASQVKSEKNKLPYSIDRGLKVTSIEDAGSKLVYVCDVDENLFDIDEMGAAKEEVKGNMEKMLKDRSMRKQAEVLASLNKGFEYKFVGNTSGKSVVIEFTAAELGELSKKK